MLIKITGLQINLAAIAYLQYHDMGELGQSITIVFIGNTQLDLTTEQTQEFEQRLALLSQMAASSALSRLPNLGGKFNG